jgi:hypothetical protein
VTSARLVDLDESVTRALEQSVLQNGTRCRQSAAPGVSSSRVGCNGGAGQRLMEANVTQFFHVLLEDRQVGEDGASEH